MSWAARAPLRAGRSRSSGSGPDVLSLSPGKADYLARYRADCLTPGNRVQLITPASRTEATALSIDDEFRLVVEYDDGRREALSAGEVSVRGMYGYV